MLANLIGRRVLLPHVAGGGVLLRFVDPSVECFDEATWRCLAGLATICVMCTICIGTSLLLWLGSSFHTYKKSQWKNVVNFSQIGEIERNSKPRNNDPSDNKILLRLLRILHRMEVRVFEAMWDRGTGLLTTGACGLRFHMQFASMGWVCAWKIIENRLSSKE